MGAAGRINREDGVEEKKETHAEERDGELELPKRTSVVSTEKKAKLASNTHHTHHITHHSSHHSTLTNYYTYLL